METPVQRWIQLAFIAWIALACRSSRQQSQEAQQNPPARVQTDLQLDRAVGKALGYMLRSCDSKGRFTYLINIDGHHIKSRKYNVLRHAGAIYSMAELLRSTQNLDPVLRDETRDTVTRAAGYLQDRYLRRLDGQAKMRAIFSRQREEGLKRKTEAKLGGAGLGLVALTAAHAIDPEKFKLETLRGLGRFVLFMQRSDGSFHHKYANTEGFLGEHVSLYYPGEAALGLLRLYEVDKDSKWLRSALLALKHLVDARVGQQTLPADHWMLIAIAEVRQYIGEIADPPISLDRLQRHGLRIAAAMIADQNLTARTNPAMRGAFGPDGRSTPTATRLEGLTALYSSLDPQSSKAERETLKRAIDDGISFLLRCQVDGGVRDGGFLRAVQKLPEKSTRFNRRQREIRIDYVQHALSALMSAREL